MTCEVVSAAQGCGGNVDAGGGRGRRGRGRWMRRGCLLLRHPRAAGIPRSGAHARQWMRRPEASVIQRPQAVEFPMEGSAVRHCYLPATNRGIASSQSPRGSAYASRRKLRSLPCSSFSAAIRFAGFASETGAAERENDSVTEESASFPWQNQRGDSSVADGSL